MRRKHALLLGGTGFIGSHILECLTNNPLYRVTALVHNRIDYRLLEKTNILKGSLSNFDITILKSDPPDLIFHSARIPGSRYLGELGRRIAAKKGKKANEKLITTLKQLDSPPKIVYVSGTLMYGNHFENEITEDFPINPVSYARNYIETEIPWINTMQDKSLDIIMVRPPWIFGNDSWLKYFYINYINKENKVPQYGEGNNWMSLLHVKDCGDLIVKYSEQAPYKNCYNLFSSEPILHREFVRHISEKLKLPIEIINEKTIVKKYGSIVNEALTSSMKISTNYKSIMDIFDFKYPDIKSFVDEISAFLKNK